MKDHLAELLDAILPSRPSIPARGDSAGQIFRVADELYFADSTLAIKSIASATPGVQALLTDGSRYLLDPNNPVTPVLMDLDPLSCGHRVQSTYVRARVLESTEPTAAPLSIASTALVPFLNSQYLNSVPESGFLRNNTFANNTITGFDALKLLIRATVNDMAGPEDLFVVSDNLNSPRFIVSAEGGMNLGNSFISPQGGTHPNRNLWIQSPLELVLQPQLGAPLRVGTSAMYVDTATNRTGFNTTSPSTDVHILNIGTSSRNSLTVLSPSALTPSGGGNLAFIGSQVDLGDSNASLYNLLSIGAGSGYSNRLLSVRGDGRTKAYKSLSVGNFYEELGSNSGVVAALGLNPRLLLGDTGQIAWSATDYWSLFSSAGGVLTTARGGTSTGFLIGTTGTVTFTPTGGADSLVATNKAVFNGSIRLPTGATTGYVWTATDNLGNGSWQVPGGGGGGSVTGIGVAGEVPFWTGTSTLGGTTAFLWFNASNKFQVIGNSTFGDFLEQTGLSTGVVALLGATPKLLLGDTGKSSWAATENWNFRSTASGVFTSARGTTDQGFTIDTNGTVTFAPSGGNNAFVANNTAVFAAAPKITAGTPGAGKVWTGTDGLGNGNWATPTTVTGTGFNEQLAYWTGANTQSPATQLWWNEAQGKLFIGGPGTVSAATATLEVRGASGGVSFHNRSIGPTKQWTIMHDRVGVPDSEGTLQFLNNAGTWFGLRPQMAILSRPTLATGVAGELHFSANSDALLPSSINSIGYVRGVVYALGGSQVTGGLSFASNNGAGDVVTMSIARNGVLIGPNELTPAPEFALDINHPTMNGFISRGVFGSGGTLTTAGSGTRAFWYPRKAAFRAGSVTGTHWDDSAIGIYSTVFGLDNRSHGSLTGVFGGSTNSIYLASAQSAIVGGGTNTIGQVGDTAPGTFKGSFSAIVGGFSNLIRWDVTSLGANATGHHAVILGGVSNTLLGESAIILGGQSNTNNSIGGVVGGYQASIADAADYSFAYGRGAVVEAGAAYSVAMGRAAHAVFPGSVVFADGTPTYTYLGNTAANQFAARATGGVRFDTRLAAASHNPDAWLHIDTAAEQGAGRYLEAKTRSGNVAYLTTAGAWTNASDRALKTAFQPIDEMKILEAVAAMPIQQWSYKAEFDRGIRHIGPMAQDFYQAFHLGSVDTHIETVDIDGIALVSIQGLYKLANVQHACIMDLNSRLARLEQR